MWQRENMQTSHKLPIGQDEIRRLESVFASYIDALKFVINQCTINIDLLDEKSDFTQMFCDEILCILKW